MDIRKLVIASDGSASSAAAVEFGLELAKLRGAEAVVLSVASPRDLEPLYDPDEPEAPTQEQLAAASPALAAAQTAAAAIGVAATLELVSAEGTDAVADAILGVAAGRDADAIIIGSRGHSRLAYGVLGSVSHAVLHATSDTTVIVVREPGGSA